MAQRRITPLSFNRPQSQFVARPTDVLTRAGSTLQNRFLQNQATADLVADFISNVPRAPGDDESLNLAAESARQGLARINESGDFENQSRAVRRLASNVARNPGIRKVQENAKIYENFIAEGQKRVGLPANRGGITSTQFEREKKRLLADFEGKGGSFSQDGTLNTLEPGSIVNADLPAQVLEIVKQIPILNTGKSEIIRDTDPNSPGFGLLMVRTSRGQKRLKEVLRDAVDKGLQINNQVQEFINQEERFAPGSGQVMIDEALNFAENFVVSGGISNLTIPGGQFNQKTTLPPGGGRNPELQTQVVGNSTPVNTVPELGGDRSALTPAMEQELKDLSARALTPSGGVAGTQKGGELNEKDQARFDTLNALNNKKLTDTAQLLTDPEFEVIQDLYPGLDHIYRTVIEQQTPGLPPDQLEGEQLSIYLNGKRASGQLDMAIDSKVAQIYNQKAQALQARTIPQLSLPTEQRAEARDFLIGNEKGSVSNLTGFTFFDLSPKGVSEGVSATQRIEDLVDVEDFSAVKELKASIDVADRVYPFDGRGEFKVSIGGKNYLMSSNTDVDGALNIPMGQIGEVVIGKTDEKAGVSLGMLGANANIASSNKFTVKAIDRFDVQSGTYSGRDIVLIPEGPVKDHQGNILKDSQGNPIQSISLAFIKELYRQSVPRFNQKQ